MTDTTVAQTSPYNGKDTSPKALKKEVADRIEDTVEATQEAVMQVADDASVEIRKLADSSTKFVRDNPGVAIAGAVGVGILVGLVLNNRD